MRQFNPYLRATAETALSRHQTKQVKSFKRMCRGHEYLVNTHWYELTTNSKPTGEKKEMLGSEAKSLNDEAKKKFYQECIDEVPGRALRYWRLLREEKE